MIFATYPTDPNDFIGSYRNEDAAIALASPMAPRGDFSRLGIVGHSMGGGAVPYLAQRAVARGWGSQDLWLVPIAPWYVPSPPNDAIKFFGLYQVIDATESCALLGTGCDAELSFMGRWSDGLPVTPAVSTDTPLDTGPVTTSLLLFGSQGECTAPINPRAATCG